jgi:hypothetical protein
MALTYYFVILKGADSKAIPPGFAAKINAKSI